jgi:predicted nucleotidyltransferase
VADVVARVFDRTEATRIVVFGTVARGDDAPDSDVDLVVVLPIVTRRHDDGVRVLRALRDPPVPVDVLILDQAGLEREADLPGVIRVGPARGLDHRPTRCSADSLSSSRSRPAISRETPRAHLASFPSDRLRPANAMTARLIAL